MSIYLLTHKRLRENYTKALTINTKEECDAFINGLSREEHSELIAYCEEFAIKSKIKNGLTINEYFLRHIEEYKTEEEIKAGNAARITWIAIYIFALLVTILGLTGGSSGGEKFAYSDKQEIQVEHSSVDTLARITITDTYRKDDIAYYVIQTNLSGDKEWTFSEAEYDEIIGLGNDAVDCTVYKLKCTSMVYSKRFSTLMGSTLDSKLRDIYNNLEDVSFYEWILGDRSVKKAYDMNFDAGDYKIHAAHTNEKEWVRSNLLITRYSFVGELDFTEKEIDAYTEVMHKVNTEIVSSLAKKENK